MNDELENQTPAQDCELEYWLQQAENYAEVQIPADDLRAIIARTCAAVNALPELLAKVKRLEGALKPFAAVVDLDVSEFCSDSDWFAPMSAQHARAPRLTVGDLRRARAALNQETKP